MLQIATMNVDTLRTTDSIDAVITNLQTNNIDIACIQETHNNRNDHIGRKLYYFFSGEKEDDNTNSTKNEIIRGGVAVAIKTQLKDNITKVKRYSSRSMEIQLKQ